MSDAVAGFTSGLQHLWAELERVEQLVRARVAVWSLVQATSDKPPEHWGLVHVTPREVDTYLAQGFVSPEQRAGAASEIVAPYLEGHEAAARLIEERLAATPERGGYRVPHLQAAFGLDRIDLTLLLLTVLPEIDGRYRLVYGYLQNDASRELPTVELLGELLAPIAPEAAIVPGRLAAGSPLRLGRLVDVEEAATGGGAPGRRQVAADERVVRYLLDDDSRGDGPLRSVTELPARSWEGYVAPAELRGSLEELSAWCAERAADTGATLLLHGPPGSGRRTTAAALAHAAGRRLLAADVRALRRAGGPWHAVVELICREARMQDAAVMWDGATDLFEDGETTPEWGELLDCGARFHLLAFAAAEDSWEPPGPREGAPFLRLSLPDPDYETRLGLWDHYLADTFDEGPPTELRRALAGAFQLTPGQIVAAVATARATAQARDPADPQLTIDDLTEGCRRQSGRRLTRLAQRVEPRPGMSFDDLVLAGPNRRQLDELRDRITLRAELAEYGRRLPRAGGLLVMFTGSSGTGKTMAAELLAQEQGVDLYRVDLAEVVSKYIGDTEKNLRRVFQEAEDANAIVFFDEADALFGKRGEVREARDRWANIEVNFLLQRVEQFGGVVILATNLRQNIDEAFMRRIHVVVEFPFPDADARFRIWQGMFPPMARPTDAEVREFAERFQIPGGGIRNVVEDAAFRALAADRDEPAITARHVAAALAREYQKLGRPITVVEFGADLYRFVEADVLMTVAAEA
jgi:AAA+ superfamily predicted ATPase